MLLLMLVLLGLVAAVMMVVVVHAAADVGVARAGGRGDDGSGRASCLSSYTSC
jgi:hypothetical protein